jgi:predicted nucleic acid-binding protein
MALYVDTSFLLGIVLQELQPLAELWEQDEVRISSILLHAESLVTLRRLGRAEDAAKLVEELISEVALRVVDEGIIEILASETRLAGCRTRDALHLATALEFRRQTGMDPAMCSLDRRLRSIASELGFRLEPAHPPARG